MIKLGLRTRPSARAIASLLALVGGGAIVVGACLPWMSYFAGLIPLRGIIGLNGRLLCAAGVLGVAAAGPLARARPGRVRHVTRAGAAALGIAVSAAAVWLLIGVRELTEGRAAHSMLAPKPGIGLVVVFIGGLLLAIEALVGRAVGESA